MTSAGRLPVELLRRSAALVIIFALAAGLSPRSVGTVLAGSRLVPGQPRALTMRVEPAVSPKKAYRVAVVRTTNPRLLARIVDDLNVLPVLKAVNCPVDKGPLYYMTFQYSSGTRRVVEVDGSGCMTVQVRGMRARTALNYPSLYDDLEKVIAGKA